MLLTPDSILPEAFPLRQPPTPAELFSLGVERLGEAGQHFSAAFRLAARLAWAEGRRRSAAAWIIGRERTLDGWARGLEIAVVVRALGLDLWIVTHGWLLGLWAAFCASSMGARLLTLGGEVGVRALPYWQRIGAASRTWRRQLRRQTQLVASIVRMELSLTLGMAPQALAWGGSVALPRPGARPLNRRRAAEQRQRRWLLTLFVADAILILALLRVAGTIQQILAPRSLTLETLRPLRQAVDRSSVQIRELPLPLLVESTVLPTATWEPVLTATPIIASFGVWEPVLPGAPGYVGPGQCTSESQYAPVGAGSFVWPADDHFLSGYDYSWRHPGLDINATLGVPIYATDSGQVVYAGWNTYGYGNFLVLDHGNGWFSAYAHLSQFYVGCQDLVTQGQIVGASGSTGNSTGPHLHFELFQTGVGQINPWTVLP